MQKKKKKRVFGSRWLLALRSLLFLFIFLFILVLGCWWALTAGCCILSCWGDAGWPRVVQGPMVLLWSAKLCICSSRLGAWELWGKKPQCHEGLRVPGL